MEGLFAMLVMFLVIFLFALAYKCRRKIALWLNDPDMVSDVKRRIILRRRIEDAEAEIQELDEKEAKGE